MVAVVVCVVSGGDRGWSIVVECGWSTSLSLVSTCDCVEVSVWTEVVDAGKLSM